VDRRDGLFALAVVGALALLAWLISFEGGAKVKAQLDVAAGQDAGGGPVILGNPVRTGIVPEKWVPHVPANAHLGRHRMYRHPQACSPNLNAPQHVAWDWMYTPPSEGDL
jgi:hypothetical protein